MSKPEEPIGFQWTPDEAARLQRTHLDVKDGATIHVSDLSAIGNKIGAITTGTITGADLNDMPIIIDHEPIHEWFELTYAQYLTIPRSVLQSMPEEWQARFVACLEELDQTIDWRPDQGRYWVQLRDATGRYVADPLMDYERGRRRIAHRTKAGKE